MTTHVTRSCVAFALLALVLLLGGALHNAAAAPTQITAYVSQLPVKLDGVANPSEWADTPMILISSSTPSANVGMDFGAKQNGTGWLFLMQWNMSSTYCKDSACFGGIELASTSNTQPMGAASAPTLMILASPSFKNNVDEFAAVGLSTPKTVESLNYKTQTTCALALNGNQYTAECYRPFTLNNASPYDFPNLGPGSTIELGFAVGEFSLPGLHLATTMLLYTLTFSGNTSGLYTTTSSTTTSSTTSSSGSTGSSSASTTTSTTSTTHTTMTTSTPAGPAPPSVTDYSVELAVLVVGFTVFILVLMMRYPRS
ncbi:MAG: hypothetical protein ABSG45_01900 [Nitrososphaerales archaeon]